MLSKPGMAGKGHLLVDDVIAELKVTLGNLRASSPHVCQLL